jgi:hypothetical protein
MAGQKFECMAAREGMGIIGTGTLIGMHEPGSIGAAAGVHPFQ